MFLDLNAFVLAQKHPVWGKFPAILQAMEAFPTAQWIWWLDFDAIIMNPRLNIFEHILDPNVMETRLLRGHEIIADKAILGDQENIRSETVPKI